MTTAAERAYERLENARLPGDEQGPLQKPSAVFGLSNAEVLEFNELMQDLEEHILGIVAAWPAGQCRRTLTDVLPPPGPKPPPPPPPPPKR
jgi:hypothetical protein